jgi:hypothetical protein
MSQLVFPALPGVAWNLTRAPQFVNRRPRSVAGRELAMAYRTYPLYRFGLNFEYLRDTLAAPDYDTLAAFINQVSLSWDSFLFTDQFDNAVAAMVFGNTDGVSSVFQLTRAFGAGGSSFVEPVQNINGVEQIFRTNWQGRQLQYKTARTNYFQNSSNINQTATWLQAVGGFWTETTSTAITGPDGTTNNLTKFVATATPSPLFKRPKVPNEPSLAAGTYVTSIWIYVPTQAGLTSWNYANDVNDTYTGATFSSTLFDQWVRASSVVTTGATSTQWDQNWRRNANVTPVVGDTFYATCTQLEVGSTVTSFIDNPLAAGTPPVTDYTIDANGVATFAAVPATTDVLDWTGNFYYRCRFDLDQVDLNAFAQGFWDLQQLDIIGAPGNRV